MKRNTRTSVVTEHVTLAFLDDEGVQASLDSELVYERHDPFAMSMVFKTLPPVTWTFSRELLLTGMYEPTGDGDVHIWPCLSVDGEAVVIFEFCSPDGEVLVQAELADCTRFADRMLACVPTDEESAHLDLDVTITQLLGGAPDLQV